MKTTVIVSDEANAEPTISLPPASGEIFLANSTTDTPTPTLGAWVPFPPVWQAGEMSGGPALASPPNGIVAGVDGRYLVHLCATLAFLNTGTGSLHWQAGLGSGTVVVSKTIQTVAVGAIPARVPIALSGILNLTAKSVVSAFLQRLGTFAEGKVRVENASLSIVRLGP